MLLFIGEFQIKNTVDAISHATCGMAIDIGAKAIVVYTASGSSARMVSRFRPSMPIVAMTTTDRIYHQLSTSWGVIPAISPIFENSDDMLKHAEETVLKMGLAKPGDNIVITAGLPLGARVCTNLIKVSTLEEE